MAGLQQLRLKSIRATGQLAEAMRTAATIKYSRVSKVREEFTPYAGGSADMLSLLGRFGICREADRISPKNCLVLFGSNRGLCGGFNAELFRFMDRALAAEDETPHIISCSRKASAYLRERSLAYEEFILSDVPDYEETHALCEHLKKLYTTGAVNRVRLIYQSYRNMLSQEPTDRQILPDPADNKISLSFGLPHTSGSLYGILSFFAIKGINLLKVESRTIPHRNWELFFCRSGGQHCG